MSETFVLGLDELDRLCEKLPREGIILLQGNLAAGKTTLVGAIAKALHVKDGVSSPTFSVMNRYDEAMFHYDIYQKGVEGFMQQGLLENLMHPGIHVIEWADEGFEKLLTQIGLEYTTIQIEPAGEKRQYKVRYAHA